MIFKLLCTLEIEWYLCHPCTTCLNQMIPTQFCTKPQKYTIHLLFKLLYGYLHERITKIQKKLQNQKIQKH